MASVGGSWRTDAPGEAVQEYARENPPGVGAWWSTDGRTRQASELGGGQCALGPERSSCPVREISGSLARISPCPVGERRLLWLGQQVSRRKSCMVAGALNGGAIMHKAVVPGDPLGGLGIYLWDLSDGGPPWRGGEAE